MKWAISVPLKTNILNAQTRKTKNILTSLQTSQAQMQNSSHLRLAPTKLDWNCCSSTAQRKPHTKQIFLPLPFPFFFLLLIHRKKITGMGPPTAANPQSGLSHLLMWPWPPTTHRYCKPTPASHSTKPKSCLAYCEAQSNLSYV